MSEVIKIKKDNYGIALEFRVFDSKGNPFNLEGKTPVLQVRKYDNSIATQLTCTVIDPTNGICSAVIPQYSFTSTIGTYYAELEIRGTDYVEDSNTFIIKVIDSVS